MDRLSDTSPRGSCQRSRLPSSRHSQGKNDAPQAEDEVLSPSMSTVAQFPADVAEHRVGSAQDAHNPGSGEQDAVSGHTAEPRHSAADANWTQPAQISLAGGLQPTSCLRATAVTGRVCDQGTVQTSARQRPLQPIRHDAHDAGAANLQAEPSRLDSLQQQSTVSQTGGTMEPAWGPHSNSPDQLQFADGAHVPFASAETTEAAPLPEVPHESARLVGAANSLVGAVIQRGSDAEADAEVLDASDMYQQSYEGHCNLSQNAEVHQLHLC